MSMDIETLINRLKRRLEELRKQQSYTDADEFIRQGRISELEELLEEIDQP